MRFLFASMLCLFLIPACVKRDNVNLETNVVNETGNEDAAVTIDPIQARAAAIASSLDDRLLAAQVLICGIDGRGKLPTHMEELIAEFPPGGVMLFRYNLNTENDAIRVLLAETVSLVRNKAGIPPFMAVDHEGGTVNRFQRGVVTLPAASVYWELFLAEGREVALAKIEEDSLRAGREISGLGINMNFAPVAEYITGDNRGFLESRSYGPDPSFTADAAGAFVRGMRRAGVLCVVKHFPGSAGPDPHYSPSVINGDRTELDRLVFPFAQVFNHGARAVMIAHSSVPAMDSEIASLSPVVMGNWLRGDIGFDGLIISDDFIMAAAGNGSPEEAAIRSIAAGSDMVLVWPANLKHTHTTFISAIEEGRLSRERLRAAAARIIYEKLKMGFIISEDLDLRSGE